MATKVYEIAPAELVDGTELEITPLKIKYLREFMVAFEDVENSNNDDEAVAALINCARICMKQFHPDIRTTEDLEDSMDMPTVYKILDVAAGIKVHADSTEVKKEATESGGTWDDLDLAKLEAEVFLLGIWKDYDELEMSLSMPELIATLGSKRELAHDEKKFLAAIQGIDLDKDTDRSQNAWEDMKARVFSGGQATSSDDVVSLQGINAAKAGFGVGMGLDYENLG
jgi:hypothetical protein